MALVVTDDRFLAAPDDADPAFELPGRQGQQVLDRKIFAPAERAADRGVADDDLVVVQPQHLGDLLPILVQPLTRRLDHDPTGIVDVGDAGLRLEEGVLLPGGAELALQHHVGGSKSGRDVALADRNPSQQIGAATLVNERRVGRLRVSRVGDGRQVLVLNHDLSSAGLCRCFVSATTSATLSPAKRTTSPQSTGWSCSISPKALNGTSAAVRTATTPGAARATLASMLDDARVRPSGEDDLQAQRLRVEQIAGISCLAGHFGQGVEPRQ